jgi:hypothetical protein
LAHARAVRGETLPDGSPGPPPGGRPPLRLPPPAPPDTARWHTAPTRRDIEPGVPAVVVRAARAVRGSSRRSITTCVVPSRR